MTYTNLHLTLNPRLELGFTQHDEVLMPLTADNLRGFLVLRRAARARLLALQPTTVFQALRIPGVGRATTRVLLAMGLLSDPDGAQHRTLAQLERDWRAIKR